MQPSEKDQPIHHLVDLATYRKEERTRGHKPDPLVIHTAYAYGTQIYRNGRIVDLTPGMYHQHIRIHPEDAVNQFGVMYAAKSPLLLHQQLADVLIDAAIDLRDRRHQFTVVMDALRTYESTLKMQESRSDLVELGLLAKAGESAHNRALAVDSKLFEPDSIAYEDLPEGNVALHRLREADEHGHLDGTNMLTNSRFYNGADMSDTARENRLERLRAWQRASVKRGLPIANLLSEFWDDRVTGSPADLWRIISCRALCIGKEDNSPKTNPLIADLKSKLESLEKRPCEDALSPEDFKLHAYAFFRETWDKVFSPEDKAKLKEQICEGAENPPPLDQFLFHEWLRTIKDEHLPKAQAAAPMHSYDFTI